jgi:hypothetical protein
MRACLSRFAKCLQGMRGSSTAHKTVDTIPPNMPHMCSNL